MSSTKKEKVLVVGAGLVGSVLSTLLSQKGYQVEVFERRADMRKQSMSAGRSINLALSHRGLKALNMAGLEKDVRQQCIPMLGRKMHAVNGDLTYQAYGKDDSLFINSISRAHLNTTLMTAAEATGHVNIHFNHNAQSVDIESNAVSFEKEDGSLVSVQGDVVIGTDGSASNIRKALVDAQHIKDSVEPLDHAYKELEILPGEGGKHLLDKNCLHIWPRGQFMLIALPNLDGSFTVTLFMPEKGPISFESIKTTEALERFFKEQFADAVPLMPNYQKDFFENPTGSLATVRTEPWNYKDKILLMGDASHAVVPFFGQGMNCGFEDVSVFMEMLDAKQSIGSVFSEFSKSRVPNANAIADMALENYIEMRDKTADSKFLLQKAIEKRLEKEFPDQYMSRYSMVSFSHAPYAEAYKKGELQQALLEDLSSQVASADELDLEDIQNRLKGLGFGDLREN